MTKEPRAYFHMEETEEGVQAAIGGEPQDIMTGLATYLASKPNVIPIFEAAIQGARNLIAENVEGKHFIAVHDSQKH